jgi:mRNA interferase RelE/StbE
VYRVTLKRPAQKRLDELQGDAWEAIRAAILALSEDPRPHGLKRLKPSGAYRIRVGDYRVIYDIDDYSQIIEVLDIGHRRDIYRRFGR